ncbi:oligoribonuclease isoform X2 [Capsicum annuum]|uniref:oligoribonuclease isoform X2 n=1 Tax=Capsicum annuum TaxID=4072 RepID=UPI0007BF0DC0|nr:oligoribonuclease isoform X2 [Capsicum annuum]
MTRKKYLGPINQIFKQRRNNNYGPNNCTVSALFSFCLTSQHCSTTEATLRRPFCRSLMVNGFHRMNQLSNAFSWLNLDVTDNRDDTEILGETETVNGRGKAKENDDNSGEFKLPLVWIDLEMTGLDIEVERILEIACIITDGNLIKSIEGPDLVIHQSKECLDKMGEWCQSHHAASGLTQKVLKSTITEEEAEKQVVEFVKRNIGSYTPMLAGNSIYTDLLFLKKYMPTLASLFSHVLVDVSSVKALCVRWYPRAGRRLKSKTSTELWMTLGRA